MAMPGKERKLATISEKYSYKEYGGKTEEHTLQHMFVRTLY